MFRPLFETGHIHTAAKHGYSVNFEKLASAVDVAELPTKPEWTKIEEACAATDFDLASSDLKVRFVNAQAAFITTLFNLWSTKTGIRSCDRAH